MDKHPILSNEIEVRRGEEKRGEVKEKGMRRGKAAEEGKERGGEGREEKEEGEIVLPLLVFKL